jgi:uncharacterized protein involved in exopolysaccharide biosynthesis
MAETYQGTSLRDFLHIVFKHKEKILAVFLLMVTTVTAVTFIMKPTYEASSKILIKFGRENIYVPATTDGSHPLVLNKSEEAINSEIEIVNGRNLIEKTIKAIGVEVIYPELLKEGRLGLRNSTLSPFDRAVLTLQKKLDVEGVKKSDVINVKFQHYDPHIAANVVNTLVNFYLDHHLEVHSNPGGYEFFREQVTLAEDKLNRSEETLEGFKDRHHISSLDDQKRLILEEVSALREDLKKTQRQIYETQKMIGKIKTQLTGDPQEITVGMEIDRNPEVIAALRERLIELQSTEQRLLTQYREEGRRVQDKRTEIGNVKKALAKEELKIYQADLEALRIRETSQRSHLGEYQRELNKLNDLDMELRRLERERDNNEKNYRLYLTRVEESRISDTMDMKKIANVSVVKPALVPLKPVKPKKLLNIVLSIFLGIVSSLGLAFFSEFMDHSITTKDQFERTLGIRLLASIPELKATPSAGHTVTDHSAPRHFNGRSLAQAALLCAPLLLTLFFIQGDGKIGAIKQYITKAATLNKRISVAPLAEERAQGEVYELLIEPKTEKKRIEIPLIIATQKKMAPWVVQVSSCQLLESAKHIIDQLKHRGLPVYVTEVTLWGKNWYRVRVGYYPTQEEALEISNKISSDLHIKDCEALQPAEEDRTRRRYGKNP